MNETRLTGTIKYWNGRKGFGFIEPQDGEKQVFIHIKAFMLRKNKPTIGQVVTYTLSVDNQGRTRADKVLYEGEISPEENAQQEKNSSSVIPFFIISALIVSAVAYLIYKASHIVG